jgi:DNA-binding NtrC family response regulator
MKNILIIDDEKEMLISLEKILGRKKEYDLSLHQNAEEAIQALHSKKFDLIITDLRIKNISGMDVLEQALRIDPANKVIIISGYGTVEAGVEAIQKGAVNFIEKPFTAQKLYTCIHSVFDTKNTEGTNQFKGNHYKEFEGIIYLSSEMERLLSTVRKISVGDASILISGESGTGKELIARAIHKLSSRKLNPFVPINCGALPENLFESELFGHERGAFTGAVKTKPGLLEFANNGAFFFDEIGDLSLPLQVKLLRMLEDQKIRRVGGVKEIEIDVRILAASNKNLEKLVEQKLFREDLYYRLSTLQIDIPPLRKRKDDILPIAGHILKNICNENRGVSCVFSEEAKMQLQEYSWPGNVRELQNLIQRAYLLRESDQILGQDLSLPQSHKNFTISKNLMSKSFKTAKEQLIQDFEIQYLKRHLKKHNGNISKTAEACKIDRRTIHRLIKKMDIVV